MRVRTTYLITAFIHVRGWVLSCVNRYNKKERNVVHAKEIQLATLIDMSSPRAVMAEIQKVFCYHYPSKIYAPVKKSMVHITKLFAGTYPGYRKCNTEYHDLTHTLDATLAAVRLMDGYNLENTPISPETAWKLLTASLLHDTGYIQETWDTEGSGAKYTSNHVERSVDFLKKNRSDFSIPEDDVDTISNIIRCTGLSVDLGSIMFNSDEELIAGCILGSADLLGQMSDRAYLEKLIFLYREFREAGIGGFDTEFDILKKTISFYEITVKRLTGAYKNISQFSKYHFNRRFGYDGDLYSEAIARHIRYLHKIMEDESTNFRHKLKRGDWIHDTPASAH